MVDANGNNGAHGRPDIERRPQTSEPLKRSAFRAMVQDFSPIWFSWCMNAGIIAILMHQLPYQFNGLPVLSTIAFMIDFVLFIMFSVVMLLRFAMFRGQPYNEICENIPDLGLLACWPIAWLTVTAFVSLIISEAHWGSHAFTIVAYVMWWFGAAWVLSTAVFVLIIITRRHAIKDRSLPPMVFIPTVGVSTLATVGGLLSSFSSHISARMAVPVIIFSFWSVGVGIFLGLIIYTMIVHQLFAKGWPAPEQSAGMFLLVGPMGQSAAALQLLGSAAHQYGRFKGYNKGTFLTETSAAPLEVACILLAFLLSGMATIWLIVAFICMIERAVKKELSWTPAWNSAIFPVGTLITSLSQFSIEMDSPFFRVMTAIGLVWLIILFFVNLGFTLWQISQGKLLIVKENPRAKQELEQQKEQ
ncbi:voltage-dependent anion channel [Exophiala viscosa]|uniref:Voltage-dependent anion channel n=1 Tax=Exophiala viscosa TaxID=2486360 RepID=A0AAN6DQH9_9EURO|nr:voltage-dependent anion channel [Exophiala viscosa]